MNKLFGLTILTVMFFGAMPSSAQAQYTRQDSLRGSITPERIWWDLTYYHLDVNVDIDNKFISGKNEVHFKVLTPNEVMQIDLQPPMTIDKVLQNGKVLKVRHETNAHFIELTEMQREGAQMQLDIYYSGNPIEAKNAPWDGGIVWSKDKKGNPFVASACQGIGASVWWPCIDHSYDEPDSMLISATVPAELMDVSNGRLRKVDENGDGTKTYHWFVSNPINNYGVNINIGNYAHFSEQYEGEKGSLDMDYYVLKYNLKKAKKQFKQAVMTIEALEHWFGPYPFYEDGYKLVEAPYLGMEHQSSVTYGNGYSNGYKGRDLSSSGWGMKFDFIIVHESGHEWFANNITNIDVADMWIHESFTSYSENLFLDYHFGNKASSEYVIGTRLNIVNDEPIIVDYGVNQRGSIDIYYKGSNILHTLRQIVNDDEKWRQTLRGLNKEFYHQTVSTKQVENFISQQVGINLRSFFDQYLRDARIPVLEYFIKDNTLNARWTNCLTEFDMPLKIRSNGNEHWINPSTEWQALDLNDSIDSIQIDKNFYVGSMDVLGSQKN